MKPTFMTKLKPGKVYRFEWVDTYNFIGWHYEEDIDSQKVAGHFQETLGFYIKESGSWHIIAAHKNPNIELGFPEWGNIVYIPKSAIRKVKALN